MDTQHIVVDDKIVQNVTKTTDEKVKIASDKIYSVNYSELDLLCPHHGYEFKADDFRHLCQPLVYIFLGKRDLPLYIGKSNNGMGRALSPDHHADKARKEAVNVLIYPCLSVEQMDKLERYLIRQLRPKYNIVNNPKACKRYKICAAYAINDLQ